MFAVNTEREVEGRGGWLAFVFALALIAVLVSRWVVSIARLKGMVVSKEKTKRFNQRHMLHDL